MTTIHQTKQLADEKNQIELTIRVPWDQTSLARFYDYFDNNYERGSLFDILHITPVSFHEGENTIEARVGLDISDALDAPSDDYFSSNPEDEQFVRKYKKEMGIPVPDDDCQGP